MPGSKCRTGERIKGRKKVIFEVRIGPRRIGEVRKEEEFWRGRKIQGEIKSNMKDPSVISKAKGGSQRKSINSCLLEESSCTHVACQWHC